MAARERVVADAERGVRQEPARPEGRPAAGHGVEGRPVEEPHQARAGREDGARHALEDGIDVDGRVADRIGRQASGAEVRDRGPLVHPRREPVTDVDMPGQIPGLVARAGVAHAVGELSDRPPAGVAVPQARSKGRPLADDGADGAVEGGLIEPVLLRAQAGKRAVSAPIREARLIVEAPPRPAEQPHVAAPAGKRSALDRGEQLGAVGRLAAPGEHLNDRADGVRAVQRRLRAAHDLDALDFGARHATDIELTAVPVDAHAVDEHEVVVRLAAPREQRAQRPFATVGFDVQAGDAGEDVGQRGAAEIGDVAGSEHRHRVRGRGAALARARGGDDNRVGEGGQPELKVAGRTARRRPHVDRLVGEPVAPHAQLLLRGRGEFDPVSPVWAR